MVFVFKILDSQSSYWTFVEFLEMNLCAHGVTCLQFQLPGGWGRRNWEVKATLGYVVVAPYGKKINIAGFGGARL